MEPRWTLQGLTITISFNVPFHLTLFSPFSLTCSQPLSDNVTQNISWNKRIIFSCEYVAVWVTDSSLCLSLSLPPGKCGGHPRADSPPQGSPGGPHPDVQAAAELRGRPGHRLPAGLHCLTDGQRGRAADPQWYSSRASWVKYKDSLFIFYSTLGLTKMFYELRWKMHYIHMAFKSSLCSDVKLAGCITKKWSIILPVNIT